MNIQNGKQLQRRLASWGVFLATLVVVLITVTTVVFPVLVVRSLGGHEDYSGINPFETGIWTYPLLVANFILLGVGILYFKNRIPQPMAKSIRFFFNFEVSAKVAFLAIVILIGFYITFTVEELFIEDKWTDFQRVKPILEKWTVYDISKGFGLHVRFFLITSSMTVFGNYKVIPFIASIALLVLTYFITTEISKKRFAGIVSMVIVLQSGTFLTYDTSVTYDNFWVLFYVLSLYTIYKKWPVSPISFILSLFSKPMTAVFVPMTFFFIYRSNIPKKKKILIAISYGALIIIGVAATVLGYGIVSGTTGFEYHDFWKAYNSISYQLRFDGLVLVFLLPLTVGLFIASRRGVAHAQSIMVLIIGMILAGPLTVALTENNSEPYRFIVLIIFFAMGLGTILSKKVSQMT